VTFYNIIFGILFLGAFREVIRSLAEGPDWTLFWQTATLSVLIFSDTIYTAVVIEGKRKRYTMRMKLLDLASFILLSLAVVVIHPTDKNMFEVNATSQLGRLLGELGCTAEALFWSLLCAYSLVLIIWNAWGKTYDGLRHHRWVMWVQPMMLVVFGVMAALTWPSPWPANADWFLAGARPAIFALSLVYLVGYKPFLTTALDSIVSLKPLSTFDAQAIRCWPQYAGAVAALDYALRAGGWLDQFPESPATRRWAAWQDGELVGFALLTDIGGSEAEFYIAVHPERLRTGLGKEITEQTVALGFNRLGLRRIHLKVRDWHAGAIKLYEQVGFRRCGTCVAPIQGQQVNFVTMECLAS
jgi:RimJ/RimL family protein N-acetyltransferase